MLFKLSNLNYLNPALNNSALTKTTTLCFRYMQYENVLFVSLFVC